MLELIGNGISAILIQPLGQKTYSLVMLCLAAFVAFFFMFVKELNQVYLECSENLKKL